MNREDVIDLFKANRPETVEDLLDLGLPLRRLGSGAFREVFHIRGTDLVVKVPIQYVPDDEVKHNFEHSQQEIRAYNRIKKSKSILKAFLPEVYYMDKDSGVILMKKYKKTTNQHVSDVIQQVVLAATRGKQSGDIYIENIGYEPHPQYRYFDRFVILDLGLF